MQKGFGPPPDAMSLTPWYGEYREEFLRMLHFGDHETISHPSAVRVLYVIPADVTNPVGHLEALQNQPSAMPPAMHPHPPGTPAAPDYMFPAKDRDFAKHYLLLQDASAPGAGEAADRRALENLAALSKAFGEANCSVLHINTGNGDPQARGAAPDFFKRAQRPGLPGGGAGEPEAPPAAPPQGVGAFLSATDLEGVAALVRKFALQSLLPRLEERIGRLNAGITMARRGLKNVITRLWKGAADDTINDRPYAWHSIEGQMRQLADLAFLLHHYDFAVSMYKLAAQDYLAHNNVRWYAGAEEMIGVSCVLDPSDGNDPLKYFMRAYEHYTRLPGKLPRMLATRAMMLCAAHQSSCGRHQSANQVLMRAHFEEENARAALLLEQAAYALLYLRQPSIRKFAFQMVLAGLRYHSCGQKRLAMQAYRQVLGVYAGKSWDSISQHLNEVLGKHCREAGDTLRALGHFMALLDCGSRPLSMQQHYLEQFFEVAKKVQTKQDGSQAIEGLPLPVINLTDIRSLYSDTACYGNTEAQAQPLTTWARLESCLSNDQSGANWLDAPTKTQKDDEEFNCCVAGEAVMVAVTFRNTLGIKLRVSGVRLICEFTPEAGATGRGGAAGTSEPVGEAVADFKRQASAEAGPLSDGRQAADPDDLHPLARAGPVRPRTEHLQVSDASFMLHPGEVQHERLAVVPLSVGWLRITGVQWVLNDSVEGRDSFRVLGRRRKRPKGDRPGQRKHFPPHRRLLFSVVAAMPRLEVDLRGLPKSMHEGEVAACTAVLRNLGTLPLRNLQLVLSGPEMCCPSDNTSLGQPLVAMLQDPTQNVVESRLPSSAYDCRAHLYKVWPGVQLAPGEALEWPLLLHTRTAGRLLLHSVWYCEPAVPVTAMRFRVLRQSHVVDVSPLLSLQPSLSTSPHDLRLCDLKLDLSAARESAVSVTQVAALSQSPEQPWHVAPMTGTRVGPGPGAAADMVSALVSASTAALAPGGSAGPGPSGSSLVVQPGEPASLYLHLLPPALLRDPVIGGNVSGGVSCRGGAGAASSAPQGLPSSSGQNSGTGLGSGAESRSSSARSQGVAGSSGRLDLQSPGGLLEHLLVSGHKGSLQPSIGRLKQAQGQGQGPGGGVGPATGSVTQSPLQLPAADPVVDVVLAWRVEDARGETGGTQVRMGLIKVPDLTAATKPVQQPIKLQLSGMGAVAATASQQQHQLQPLVVRHDFRANATCVVPLKLMLRNCAARDAEVVVEAGSGWSGAELKGAWQMGSLLPSMPQQHGPASPEKGFEAAGAAPALVSSQSMAQRGPAGAGGGADHAAYGGAYGPGHSGAGVSLQAGLPPSPEYIWCGRTHVHLGCVEGGACRRVDLQVCVFRPGTFTISDCRVTATYAAAGLSAAELQSQALVVNADKLLLRVDTA